MVALLTTTQILMLRQILLAEQIDSLHKEEIWMWNHFITQDWILSEEEMENNNWDTDMPKIAHYCLISLWHSADVTWVPPDASKTEWQIQLGHFKFDVKMVQWKVADNRCLLSLCWRF